VDYDLLRNAVCDSMETSHKQASSFHMNCPLKSCRSCNAFAAATSSSNSSLSSHNAASTTTAQTNNNNEQQSNHQQETKTTKHIHSNKCDRKTCNVGRNSKKRPMIGFPKINLIDFTKIKQGKRNMKMCMKTKLVDGGGTSSDAGDYMPLLITSTDDLVLPLNAEESNFGNKKSGFSRRINKDTLAQFLDTLTRTFCLPLLG